jgi:hypothetical protein
MDKLDKMERVQLEVSGTMSNADCALPTEEDSQLLDDIQKSNSGKEKGATVNWPAFSESPISEYGEKSLLCMLFPWLYPVGNWDFNESQTADINVKDWARQKMFLADGRFTKDNM